MSLPPTPASLLRNVLQAVVGLLDLSTEEDIQITIPRFYLLVWREQLETILVLLDDPLYPSAPRALVATAALAFVVGVTLGLVLRV
jgi:hypothetical protein